MRSIYIILVAFVTIFSTANANQSIIAIVDKGAITDLDLNRRVDLITKINNIKLNDDSSKAIRWQVIQMLIDEKLYELEAKKMSITVDDIDVVNAFSNLANANNMRPPQLESYMKSIGVSKDEFNKQLYHQLLWAKIIKTQIEPIVSVTEQDLKLIKPNTISSDRTNDRVQLAEITIVVNKSNEEKALNLLQNLVSQIKDGADFGKLASEFSQTSNKKRDGTLGWFYISQLSNEVALQVMNLKPGEVTQPIISEDGVTIYKVLKRNDDSGSKIELTEDDIKESIYQKKLDMQIKYYINKIRQQTYINILQN